MAITGIREMSTITTPPEERHPVLTYVGGYEDRQVVAAVRRELLRDGQVFYIHNRVQSIEKAAAKLRELVPDARVATAHGQMGEHQLEQVMLDFWEKRFDVLVCTTIVESGLDVSNANTMIIERADTLGLSQLHQLRGRVGRSRERAYAYFLYPTEKPMTETAHERLATLAQHSDLGGGMAIAMKDLEIRGAGNLLGGEQSGHIADVGFDLYVRLVGEAVRDFRDDAPEQLDEIRIELPVDAHLPHDYIPSERLRLEMYKRLAEVRTDADVDEINEELDDRYGEPPMPVVALMLVARFRARARQAGLREITVLGKNVRFAPVTLPDSRVVRLQRMYPKSIVKTQVESMLVPRPGTPGATGRPLEGIALLEWARVVIDTVIDPAKEWGVEREARSDGPWRPRTTIGLRAGRHRLLEQRHRRRRPAAGRRRAGRGHRDHPGRPDRGRRRHLHPPGGRPGRRGHQPLLRPGPDPAGLGRRTGRDPVRRRRGPRRDGARLRPRALARMGRRRRGRRRRAAGLRRRVRPLLGHPAGRRGGPRPGRLRRHDQPALRRQARGQRVRARRRRSSRCRSATRRRSTPRRRPPSSSRTSPRTSCAASDPTPEAAPPIPDGLRPEMEAPADDPLAEFVAVMRRLRAECPWKKEQTHRSLARYLLEETYETLEAIDTASDRRLGAPA